MRKTKIGDTIETVHTSHAERLTVALFSEGACRQADELLRKGRWRIRGSSEEAQPETKAPCPHVELSHSRSADGSQAVVITRIDPPTTGECEVCRKLLAFDGLLKELRRMTTAALCREITRGDPCRLLEVQAELRAASAAAREAIAKAEGRKTDHE